jgi:hypothetical protein
MKSIWVFLSIIFLTSCAFESPPSGESTLKPRTESENQAITDAWFPIKNQECQAIVDAFGLMRLASMDAERYLATGDTVAAKQTIDTASEIVLERLSSLISSTTDESIRLYTLKSLPIFSQLSSYLTQEEGNFDDQLKFLEKWAELTGEIPSGCKS